MSSDDKSPTWAEHNTMLMKRPQGQSVGRCIGESGGQEDLFTVGGFAGSSCPMLL